jgi:Ca2+:H+ antiporter
LIVSVIALTKDEITIVKTSLIGGIVSNLLLVMGMCFFFGCLRREEQFFNVTAATTAASLLALATAAVIIPSAFVQGESQGIWVRLRKISRRNPW